MKKALALLVLASTACAYHSPTQPSPPPPDLTSPATLQVTAAPGRGTATITALVSNRVGSPLASVPVTFGTDAGRITPETATTNAQGVATAGVLAPAGAARITATAGTITTAALVAIQPVSPGTQAGPDVPTPEPTPLPVPPPTGQPLTVQIVGTPSIAGTPTILGLSVNAQLKQAVWDFGDTSPLVTTTGTTATHVYGAGTYTASVVVTDDLGRIASAQTSLVIAPAASAPPTPTPTLTAVITCSPPVTHNPATATPCNLAATYGSTPLASGAVTLVDWDWGDGATTPNGGVVNTHPYVNAGTYPVVAAVTATTIDGPKTTTATKAVLIP